MEEFTSAQHFWAGGIIGPYFFEDEAGQAATVNGNRYCVMIKRFLWPCFNGMDIQELWFQQDGATRHASRKTIQLLHEQFPDRLISRNGDHQWPPISCDLTPCDFFFFGVFLNHWCMSINPEISEA